MMRVINNFKATLDKSYIQYSFAPIINKAIRAGKSGEVIDKVVNNPSSICDLNIYNLSVSTASVNSVTPTH